MKLSANQFAGVLFTGLIIVVSGIQLTHSERVQNPPPPALPVITARQTIEPANGGKTVLAKDSSPATLAALPPFILTDTTSSSPDTNLVGNLVIFTAKIGGTPPVSLQWKVNRGSGFFDVSATATNSWLGLTNAQISDTGIYAIFATNAAGSVHTTPRAITLVDGVD